MAFVDTLRETQRYTQDDAERRANIVKDWDKLSQQFTDSYNSYLKNTGRKEISELTARQKLRDFIGKAGTEDGKWSSDDYSNSNYDEYDFQKYGTQTIKDLLGENGTMDFGSYVAKYGNADQKRAYEKQNKEQSTGEKVAKGVGLGAGLGALAATGPIGWAAFSTGAGIGSLLKSGSEKSLSDLEKKYTEEHNNALNTAFDAFENADKYLSNRDKVGAGAGAGASTGGDSSTAAASGDEVTFQLDRANDPNYKGFGQKIVDLGLATDKGLWGSNGDVAFYTKQLYDQGALDANGNLKIGVPIKLKRRK